MNRVTVIGTVEAPVADGVFLLATGQAQVPVLVRSDQPLPEQGARVVVEGSLLSRHDDLLLAADSVHVFHMV